MRGSHPCLGTLTKGLHLLTPPHVHTCSLILASLVPGNRPICPESEGGSPCKSLSKKIHPPNCLLERSPLTAFLKFHSVSLHAKTPGQFYSAETCFLQNPLLPKQFDHAPFFHGTLTNILRDAFRHSALKQGPYLRFLKLYEDLKRICMGDSW